MIPDSASTVETVRLCVAHSISALSIAASIDLDRSADDKAFLLAQRETLIPVSVVLRDAARALEDFDLETGMVQQASVILGDVVLDRGISVSAAHTKLGLKGKSGLDATHVFGTRLSDLTNAPLRLEPSRVLQAAARLDDVDDFANKAAIKSDLITRANQQETLLEARDEGSRTRAALSSKVAKAQSDAILALHALHGVLSGRFPKQREYVNAFFREARTHHAAKGSTPAAA